MYLYGIEMKDIRATIESPDSSNCTFMELKYKRFLEEDLAIKSLM